MARRFAMGVVAVLAFFGGLAGAWSLLASVPR
jgi:hypothetical protein